MHRRSLLGSMVLPFLLRAVPVRAAELQPVAIPIASTGFGTSALRVAHALGLFERHGLAAKVIIMDSGNVAMAAMIGGSAPVAEAGPAEMVAARARGQPVVAVANLYRGFTASVALARAAAERSGVRPDAPVADRLKALDGLVVASPSATSIYTFGLRKAAEAAGARVRFTYMAQPAMAAALESGAIAGMIAGSPFWIPPVVHDKALPWISGPRGEFPPDTIPRTSAVLVTLESTVRNDPALVRSLRAVIADLGTAIDQRRGDVAAAERTLFPGLDEDTFKLLIGTEMQNLRTAPFTVVDMAHEVDQVRSAGSAVPNLSGLDPASLLADP